MEKISLKHFITQLALNRFTHAKIFVAPSVWEIAQNHMMSAPGES